MPLQIFAQGISNLWLMGYDSGTPYQDFGGTTINFNSGYGDTVRTDRTMNFRDCNANISDSAGNLLFYTNGIYIADATNDTMLNGDSLNPSPYTNSIAIGGPRIKQGALILPFPGHPNQYYLFHETIFFISSGNGYRSLALNYSIVDMSLNNGLGAVIEKNSVLISDTLNIGAITACKHANGRDWWIICHRALGKTYHKFLLTPAGLQGPFSQNIGTDFNFATNDDIWQSCFSPDGKKFASFISNDTLDIFGFDRCTGMLSTLSSIDINDSQVGRGLAFSSNSRYLYASSSIYLYQFDTDSNNIDASKILINQYDGFADYGPPLRSGFYLSALAADNKIYIATGNGTRFLHVINNPDQKGLGCNFIQHSFVLPTFYFNTIPNFPNYFLGADSTSICDTLAFRNLINKNNNFNSAINFFPNPSDKEITLSYSIPENTQTALIIYTSTLKEISRQTLNAREEHKHLNIEDLKPDLYIYNIIQDDHVISSGRFSVVH